MEWNKEKITAYANKVEKQKHASKAILQNIERRIKLDEKIEKIESRSFTLSLLLLAAFNSFYILWKLLFSGLVYALPFAAWAVFLLPLLPELILIIWASKYFVKGYHYHSFFTMRGFLLPFLGVPALLVYLFILYTTGSLWEILILCGAQILGLIFVFYLRDFQEDRIGYNSVIAENYSQYKKPRHFESERIHSKKSILFSVLLFVIAVGISTLGFTGVVNGFALSKRNVSYAYNEIANEYTVKRIYPSIFKDTFGWGKEETLVIDEEVKKLCFEDFSITFQTGKVVNIDQDALKGTTSIKKVVLPASMRMVETGAFKNSEVEHLEINSSKIHFSDALIQSKITHVFVQNADCRLSMNGLCSVQFIAPREIVQTLRASNAQYAPLFAPQIDADEFFVNYNYGDYKTEIYSISAPQALSLETPTEDSKQECFFYRQTSAGNLLVEDGSFVQENTNVCYAQAPIHMITYNPMGGSMELTEDRYVDINLLKNPLGEIVSVVGIEAKDLAKAEKTGYTFLGWLESSDSSTPITTLPFGATGNKQLTAAWELIIYAVEYVYVTEEGTPLRRSFDNANETTYTVESDDISLVSAQANGYTFDGWYTDAEMNEKVNGTAIPTGSVGNKQFYTKVNLDAPDVQANGYIGIYDGTTHSLTLDVSHTAKNITGEVEWFFNEKQVHTSTLSLNANEATAELPVKTVSDSGGYSYKVIVTDGELFHAYQGNGEISVQISAAPVSVTWKNTRVVYNGAQQLPQASFTGVITGESLNANVVGGGTEASEQAYTAQVEWGNANYQLSNPTTEFYIDKAEYDMQGVRMSAAQFTYDGKAHSIVVEGVLPTGIDGVQVTVSYEGEATNATATPLTVKATFATTSINYNAPQEMSAELTILPATITANFVGYKGTDDGASHAAATVATATGVKGEALEILYSLNGEAYTTELPSVSTVGQYTVYYRIGQGNGNYQLLEGSFIAEVLEAPIGEETE